MPILQPSAIVALLFAAHLAQPQTLIGSTTVFLRLGGIKGESVHTDHKDEINVQAWSWSLAKPINATSASWSDLEISKQFDRTSPKLMETACKGTSISNAVITMLSEAGSEFYRLEVSPVRTTLLNLAGGNENMTETLMLSFDRMRLDYVRFNPTGSPRDKTGMEWDRAANTGSGFDTNLFIASLVVARGSSTAELTWPTTQGKSYSVLVSSAPDGTFTSMGTYAAGESTSLSVFIPVDKDRLFFRIQEL